MNLVQAEVKTELKRFIQLIGNEMISKSNEAKEYEQTEIIKKSLNEFLENFDKFSFNSMTSVCTLRLKIVENIKF